MTQTRIRWNDEEKTLVATEILRLRAETPDLSMVVAVRTGQSVLPPTRQREIKAWSQLEPTMQPVLDALALQKPPLSPAPVAARASSEHLPSALVAAEPKAPLTATEAPAENRSGEPLQALTAEPVKTAIDVPGPTPEIASPTPTEPSTVASPSGPHTPALDLLQTESVLLAAFQSPVVELALVDLFSRAMSGALKRLAAESSGPAQDSPIRSNAITPTLVRVLVAGFAGPELKRLADSLAGQYEVRSWAPMQGPQLFETLANICAVAVIPQEFGDEIEEALDQFKLKVLRHDGSPARLQERLDELLGTGHP